MQFTQLDKDIFRFSVPTLGALVAEPVMLMCDTAMVGRLGITALAGVGVSSTVLNTCVGLFIFLAYAASPHIAQHVARNNITSALNSGVNGLWLSLGIGSLVMMLGYSTSSYVVHWFTKDPATAAVALSYLDISFLGLIPILVSTAATGILRGLSDTVTPLKVMGIGCGCNVALNYLLIYPCGFGVVGSALGTVIAQWGMAIFFVWKILQHCRGHQVALRPGKEGLSVFGTQGGWLFLRSLVMRIGLLIIMRIAASTGTIGLASVHIQMTLLSLYSLTMDSLAIAAQLLMGKARGTYSNPNSYPITGPMKRIISRLTLWSFILGIVCSLILSLISPFIGKLFSNNSTVISYTLWLTLLSALTAPLAAYVFTTDGIAMGLQDNKYLSLASIFNVAVLCVWLIVGQHMTQHASLLTQALTVWSGWSIAFLGARALTLRLRLHYLGHHRPRKIMLS